MSDEPADRAADLPPAAAVRTVRLSDVIEELRAIAALVSVADGTGQLALACRRAEELLTALQEQFLQEVVGDPVGNRNPALSRSGR